MAFCEVPDRDFPFQLLKVSFQMIAFYYRFTDIALFAKNGINKGQVDIFL